MATDMSYLSLGTLTTFDLGGLTVSAGHPMTDWFVIQRCKAGLSRQGGWAVIVPAFRRREIGSGNGVGRGDRSGGDWRGNKGPRPVASKGRLVFEKPQVVDYPR